MTVDEFAKIENDLKASLIAEIKKAVKSYKKDKIMLIGKGLDTNKDWDDLYFSVQTMVADKFSQIDTTANVDYLEVNGKQIMAHVIGNNIDETVPIDDMALFTVYDYDFILKLLDFDGVRAINY